MGGRGRGRGSNSRAGELARVLSDAVLAREKAKARQPNPGPVPPRRADIPEAADASGGAAAPQRSPAATTQPAAPGRRRSSSSAASSASDAAGDDGKSSDEESPLVATYTSRRESAHARNRLAAAGEPKLEFDKSGVSFQMI